MLTNRRAMPILPVIDLERARNFYEKKLGLTKAADAVDAIIFEAGGGTMLEIEQRDHPTKAEHTAITFEVDAIEREVAELEGRGVTFEDYDLPGLSTSNHIARMNGVKAAWFKDPDGNILCLHERLKAA